MHVGIRRFLFGELRYTAVRLAHGGIRAVALPTPIGIRLRLSVYCKLRLQYDALFLF